MIENGTVIAHYGIKVLVKYEDGRQDSVKIGRNAGHVVGDEVEVRGEKLKRKPRRNYLARSTGRHKEQVVAANLDGVGILSSATPSNPETFLDHVLIASKLSGLTPFIVVSKADMSGAIEHYNKIKKIYSDYCKIFLVSTTTMDGIACLRDYLEICGRTIFLGVSGIGKSSLVNALVPDALLQVGHISDKYKIGKHTTTMSSLHKLGKTGEIIDSPGVRGFAPIAIKPTEVAQHFADFRKILNKQCTFRNCMHSQEPGCQIKAAVNQQKLSKHRYEIYLRLIEECQGP